jgi:hypothetical protein
MKNFIFHRIRIFLFIICIGYNTALKSGRLNGGLASRDIE